MLGSILGSICRRGFLTTLVTKFAEKVGELVAGLSRVLLTATKPHSGVSRYLAVERLQIKERIGNATALPAGELR